MAPLNGAEMEQKAHGLLSLKDSPDPTGNSGRANAVPLQSVARSIGITKRRFKQVESICLIREQRAAGQRAGSSRPLPVARLEDLVTERRRCADTAVLNGRSRRATRHPRILRRPLLPTQVEPLALRNKNSLAGVPCHDFQRRTHSCPQLLEEEPGHFLWETLRIHFLSDKSVGPSNCGKPRAEQHNAPTARAETRTAVGQFST